MLMENWKETLEAASRPGWKAKSKNAAHNSSTMLPVAVLACLIRSAAAVSPISNTAVGWLEDVPQVLQRER